MHTFLEKNEGLVKFIGIFIAIFLVVATLGELKAYRYIGSGTQATNTITVSGEGRVERAPDTAKITFSARSEATTIAPAQSAVSEKIDAVTKALADLGIEARYIKTDSYSSYPQYTYPQTPCYGGSCAGNPTIRGYEVVHTVTVAVKDLEKVNDVLGVLGQNAVSDISGPNFGFEDDKAIAREARAIAIEDAEAEAKALARALGVKLVRIVSFNENGGAMPFYARMEAGAADAVKSQAAPALPVGDQKVQAAVTIVYEIR